MNPVVAALVSHEYRWTVIVEMASVVVSIHCERPATSHLVREEEGLVLCCIIAHSVLGRAYSNVGKNPVHD